MVGLAKMMISSGDVVDVNVTSTCIGNRNLLFLAFQDFKTRKGKLKSKMKSTESWVARVLNH